MDIGQIFSMIVAFFSGNLYAIVVFVVIAYLYITTRVQDATQIVEAYVAALVDGTVTSDEKKKIAMMIVEKFKIFSFLPAIVWQTIIGWLIDRVIANVNKSTATANVDAIVKAVVANKAAALKK